MQQLPTTPIEFDAEKRIKSSAAAFGVINNIVGILSTAGNKQQDWESDIARSQDADGKFNDGFEIHISIKPSPPKSPVQS